MDLETGTVAIFRTIALLKDEDNVKAKINNLMDSVHEDKSRMVTSVCEAVAALKDDADRKTKIINSMEEISNWWTRLIDDREKLLLTISNLEMENESLKKKVNDPQEIYGQALETESSLKMKPRLDLPTKTTTNTTDKDD